MQHLEEVHLMKTKPKKMFCFRNIHADPWFLCSGRYFKPTNLLSKFSCLINFILWHSKHLQGHSMSNHQTIHKNLTYHLRNGWNLVCMFSLRCWTTTKFYFIRTSIAQDIGHWQLLIKSHFLPMRHLATSLGIPESEYL